MINYLGLQHVAHLRIGSVFRKTLSGGEKKRVAIGVELVTDPSILVLDEPTSGLDSFTALALYRMLHKFAHERGKTVVGAVHQPSSAAFHSYFDRLYILHDGHMVYQGTTGGLVEHMKGLGVKIDRFKNPADTFIKILGTCKNNNKKLKMFMRAYDRDIIDSVRSEQGYYTFDQLMKIDLGSDK